jgi:membrane fusion protein (multidrug efflux system)
VELQAREEDAGIIEARAQVAQAQRQFDRYKTLADRGIAPRVTVEDAETALATAQASLTAAQARRGDRLIRAPFAGVLGLSSVTAGTLVNPGGVITTLDDIDVVRVDFPVPERYLGVLRAGTPIRATIDAYDDEVFGGRIALIDTRINEQTRAVTARAEIPNPGARILPSSKGSAWLPAHRKRLSSMRVMVPSSIESPVASAAPPPNGSKWRPVRLRAGSSRSCPD